MIPDEKNEELVFDIYKILKPFTEQTRLGDLKKVKHGAKQIAYMHRLGEVTNSEGVKQYESEVRLLDLDSEYFEFLSTVDAKGFTEFLAPYMKEGVTLW